VRYLSKFLLTIFLAIIAVVLCSNTLEAKATNWGLHFPKENEQPTGPVTAEHLKQYDSFFIGSADEKIIYITFDAGYENNYTAEVLDTLKKHEVPAAFFLVGSYIKTNPELVKRMVEEGHIVANHTMTHPDMSKINHKESFAKELLQVEDIYKEVVGNDMPKYYRPPRGIYSETNLKLAQELGYKTVFWSAAYKDWEDNNQPSKHEAFSKLMPRLHPGMVLLLHNTSKTNSVILDELLTKYKEQGYSFGSLDDLVK